MELERGILVVSEDDMVKFLVEELTHNTPAQIRPFDKKGVIPSPAAIV